MIIKSKTALGRKESVRSFIGINIPFDISRQISSFLKVFSKENRNFVFTNVEQYHITLQFLGDEVSKESLEQINNKLYPIFRKIKSPLITTENIKFGHKSQTIPTVMFIEILPTEELQDITRVIHYAIKDLGLPDVRKEKDYKKLIYHITVGRAKHHVSRSFGRKINQIISSNNIPELSFVPEAISILNSKFTIKGHKYSEFANIKFAK